MLTVAGLAWSKLLIKRNSFLDLGHSGSSAMGLVSNGDDGVMDLRSARMWLFFKDEGKVDDEKYALMRAVR